MTADNDYETVDLYINMGPVHPATHGVFRAVLVVDGELVVDVEPVIGYMHRGGEKLSENLDYRQGIGIQDRTDYLGNMNCEQTYVMAAEKLAGIEPPERAEFIRTICVELNRVGSHFMFLGAYGQDIGTFGTAFIYAFRERERVMDFFEELTGERMMYSYFRVGGVAWELTGGFERKCRELIKQLRVGVSDFEGLLTENEVFLSRTRNVGVISAEKAIDYGLTGPMLRASGVAWDLRREEPYSVYPRLDFNIPIGENGDCWDRYRVRLEEIKESLKIVEQCLEMIPAGPIMPDKMPRMLRLPAGEIYVRTENPRGEYGIYLVSKGGNKPYRLKMRSPCFCNLSALKEMTIGEYVADAVAIIGALDLVMCEVDR
ncbi:MAG: NADH-quinone oxidoreductase subunit D [Chloroflexi bacterium]|nr:NADH-quinone oxidoreductase subunit D [Chloroflexota bacterium]